MKTKEALIIKLYKEEMFPDYFEISSDEFTTSFNTLKHLANQCGFELFFTAQHIMPALFLKNELGAFAEVSYTKDLPQDLKDAIISALKIFSKDWLMNKKGVFEIETLSMIKFTKIENSEFMFFN